MLAKECLFKMYTREGNFPSFFLFERDMSCIFISPVCTHITHMFPGGVWPLIPFTPSNHPSSAFPSNL